MKVGAIAETVTVTGRSAGGGRAERDDGAPPLRRWSSCAAERRHDVISSAAMNPGVTLARRVRSWTVGGMSGRQRRRAAQRTWQPAGATRRRCSTASRSATCKARPVATGYTYSPLLFAQVDVLISGQQAISPRSGVQTKCDSPLGPATCSQGRWLANGSKPSLQSNNLTSRLTGDLARPSRRSRHGA